MITMTADIRFNSSTLIRHNKIPLAGSLPTLGTYDKTISEKRARRHGEYVNAVLDSIFNLKTFLELDKPYVSIDVKYTHLTSDSATCGVPGWHCDGNTYPFRGNRYFILTSPPTTEMMENEIHLPAYEGIPQKELLSLLNGVPICCYSIDPYTVYEYGCDRFHRGAIVDEDVDRLLIRVCCSDYIRPN